MTREKNMIKIYCMKILKIKLNGGEGEDTLPIWVMLLSESQRSPNRKPSYKSEIAVINLLVMVVLETLQTTQTLATLLESSPEQVAKTLLLKTSHNLDSSCREVKLELNWKHPP